MLSHFILAGADACKGERVQWFLACNNKDLDENNNLSHFILAGGDACKGRDTHNAKSLTIVKLSCGPDGTRTRDPMRDRHVF